MIRSCMIGHNSFIVVSLQKSPLEYIKLTLLNGELAEGSPFINAVGSGHKAKKFIMQNYFLDFLWWRCDDEADDGSRFLLSSDSRCRCLSRPAKMPIALKISKTFSYQSPSLHLLSSLSAGWACCLRNNSTRSIWYTVGDILSKFNW